MVEVMRSCVETTVIDMVEDGDREKKKSRRRSNRRSKQNSSSVSGLTFDSLFD